MTRNLALDAATLGAYILDVRLMDSRSAAQIKAFLLAAAMILIVVVVAATGR